MDALCDMYKDPKTGINRCKELKEDKRCGSGGMHKEIILALSGAKNMPATAAAAKKLCSCSCWADIVDVYGPVFAQVPCLRIGS